MSKRFTSLQKGHAAERVVAKHGFAAWLVLFCAALMSFLTLYALTLGSIANRLALSWQAALTESATVRIIAPEDRIDAISAAVEETLNTTTGILHFEALEDDAQLELLKPWLGEHLPKEILNLPKIYTVKTSPEGVDEEGLLLRLKAEAPEAEWDNHRRWQGPLLKSAKRLRFLSWVSSAIIAVSFMLLIFLAAEASIAANANTIRLLRQVGATDRWIQSGFVRKFTFRSLIGAVIGVLIGLVASYWLVDRTLQSDSLAQGIDIGAFHPVNGLIVIVIAAALGLVATRWATRRYLEKNS